MIFLTVGTQLGFDRLVRSVDIWLDNRDMNNKPEIFAQIANGSYKPRNFDYIDFLSQHEYDNYFKKSKAIISHVGMGTIITCLCEGKPLIAMPRDFNRNEHRNNHQYATYQRFKGTPGCFLSDNSTQIMHFLDNYMLLEGGKINTKNIDFCKALSVFID